MGFGHAAWNVGILQGNVMVLQAPLAFWQGACMATRTAVASAAKQG